MQGVGVSQEIKPGGKGCNGTGGGGLLYKVRPWLSFD